MMTALGYGSGHDSVKDRVLIGADGLVVGYRRAVCRPVSFTVRFGEIVGLAGPNGSGKTTLLHAVVTGDHVLSGSLTRHAGELTSLEQHRDTPDEAPFTGEDLLRVCRAFHRDPPPGLLPLLASRLDLMSGGQVQLLRVWACMGGCATLVLLDEPTNHLDPTAQFSLERMLDAGRPDRGMLLVSHDRGFLERTCDRVVDVVPAVTAI